jgi:hypothetical protein
MCAKNRLNFALAGILGCLICLPASCTRKTTREVIGPPPVALETPTLGKDAPSEPASGDGQESVPRFDGSRPETIAIPPIDSQRPGKFADVYSELSGIESVPCSEVNP